jgi:hypothetical protein
MPVYHLNIEIEFDFQLVGITCHERDYRLAWSINKTLGWNFEKQDGVHQVHNDGLHSLFSCNGNEDGAQYLLVQNKAGFEFLLPELQHYDYFLKIENDCQEKDDEFFRDLRSVPLIIAAFPVVVEKLKSKQNLIWS